MVAPNYVDQLQGRGEPAAKAAAAAAARAAAGAAPKRRGVAAAGGAAVAAAPPPGAGQAKPPQRKKKAAAAGGGGGAGGSAAPQRLGPVESLAAWQGVPPGEMARRLAGMSREQRDALREEYAGPAEGGWEGD